MEPLPLAPFAWTGAGSLPFSSDPEARAHARGAYPELPFAAECPRASGEPPWLGSWWPAAWVAADTDRGVDLAPDAGPAEIAAHLARVDPTGIPTLVTTRERIPAGCPVAKVQLPGPVTLLASTRLASGEPLWNFPPLRPIAAEAVARAAAWLATAARAADTRALVVIDEPAASPPLCSGDNPANVALWNLFVEAVRDAGGWPGMHHCGVAPFETLLHADFEFLSVDAVRHADGIRAHARTLERFLRRGTRIGLGIIDAAEPLPDIDTLTARLRALPPMPAAGIVLTATCGTARATVATERALAARLAELATALRAEISQ